MSSLLGDSKGFYLQCPIYHQNPKCGRGNATGKERLGELLFKYIKRTSLLQPL